MVIEAYDDRTMVLEASEPFDHIYGTPYQKILIPPLLYLYLKILSKVDLGLHVNASCASK